MILNYKDSTDSTVVHKHFPDFRPLRLTHLFLTVSLVQGLPLAPD